MKNNARVLALRKKNKANIRVMVISEDHHQRVAFSDTIRSWGFVLVGCVSCAQLQKKPELIETAIDLWLIDSVYDDHIVEATTASKAAAVLVGFSQAPYLNEVRQYAKWQRKLQRKLTHMLSLPVAVNTTVQKYDSGESDWHYVVFLGASMGGPSAVKEFLDNLSPTLPICLLLAHHFNKAMIDTLPRILNRHNDWHCQLISSSQYMRVGQCLIAPVDQQIVCDSAGRVILLDQAWSGDYKPAIGEILKNTSDVYGNELINIIFSGMGNDGSQYLDLIQDNNSQLWAQDPNLSACPSQPQAIIDSGYCNFIGSPAELAKKLTDYIGEKAAVASTP